MILVSPLISFLGLVVHDDTIYLHSVALGGLSGLVSG